MPREKYDRYFGGKGGAAKAHASMVAQYGAEKADEVFYGTINKKKKRTAMMHGARHAR